MIDLTMLDFEKRGGVVSVVTQDARTGVVLMTGHADREALQRTIATEQMHYRSRRRGLWHKGATSGNVQRVVSLTPDCDGDVVLARVVPAGPACHLGQVSCFGDVAMLPDAISAVDGEIERRAQGHHGLDATPDPTRVLLFDRTRRLDKVGEEARALVTACDEGDRTRAVEEAADLLYHTLVALRALGAGWDEVRAALAERARSQAA
jgi:phosphoribosyl-ATP pyrophosphohydrolase/phosphoribosyl-AMP cyclohydrolase